MILDTLWQEFLKILCAEVGSRVVETWFKAVTLVQWDAHLKCVYLRAPNVFIKEWITLHYQQLVKDHLARLLNESSLTIRFVEDSSEPVFYQHKRAQPLAARDVHVPARTSSPRGILVPHHQFDTFVVCPSNSLAYAAARAVTENPGVLYNPLLIWGETGLGKTHLLQAIGNRIKQANHKAQILYQSADRFVHEFIAAVRSDRVNHFEARFKGVDVLLMDDLQCMSNKEQTQEMFFQIFSSMQSSRKQVVFTSSTLPRDIEGFSDRIRSRIEGGMVADLQSIPLDARVQILHNKAEAHNVRLENDLAYFIASRTSSNIRDLEGGLIRVLAFASLTQQPLSIELVGRVLTHVQESKRVHVDLGKILRHISRTFDYAISDLKSVKRTKDLTFARHIAVYLMKKMTDNSLREIALFLDRKDHSTIIHALTKMEEHRIKDGQLAALLARLEKEILN